MAVVHVRFDKKPKKHIPQYDLNGCILLAEQLIKVRSKEYIGAYRQYLLDCYRRGMPSGILLLEWRNADLALREFSVVDGNALTYLQEQVEKEDWAKCFKSVVIKEYYERGFGAVERYLLPQSIVKRWLREAARDDS